MRGAFSCLAAFAALSAPAAPAVLAAPAVTVRVVGGEGGEAARRLLETEAPGLVALAAIKLDLPPPPAVEIVLVTRTPRDAAGAAALGIPPAPYWAAGLADPAASRIVLFADRVGAAPHDGLQGLVVHEASHLVLGQSLPGGARLPRWYDEGLALAVERDLSLRDAFELARMAVGDPVPLADLAVSWPASAARSRAAYAEALAVVAHARGLAAPGAPRRLVEALHAGAPFERAFPMAYGVDLGALERDWRRSLRHESAVLAVLALSLAGNAAFGVLAALAVVRARRRRRRAIEALPDAPPAPDDAAPPAEART